MELDQAISQTTKMSHSTLPCPKFVQKQPVEFDQAISYVNKIKNRFANDDRVYKVRQFHQGARCCTRLVRLCASAFLLPSLLVIFCCRSSGHPAETPTA